MSPESNSQTATLIDGLAALRDRYISMLSDAEHQAEHAKVQLVHLNALLVDQMFSPGLAPANLGTAEFQPASSSAALPPAAADIPVFIAPVPAVSAPVAPRGKKAAAPKAPVTKGRKAPGQMSKSSTRETVLPLLPPYGGLTKIQAVQRVMEEHSGKEIHLEEVIRILHGELDKITLRQERGRMRNLMWRGADRKLWDKIRGKDSYYTLKMSLLTSSPAAKTTTGRGRGKAKAAAAEPVAAATAAPTAAKAAKTTTRAPKAPKAAKAAKPVKAVKPTRITKAAAAKAAKAEAEAAAKATAKKETPIRIIKAKDAKPARGATKTAAKATAAPSIDAGSSLMGSVEQVLRANKGKSMTAEEIATAIFGNLDRNMLTQVKKQISDRLAKGVKYKRWQRVPNKIGSYIYA
jgi:hypothetical protein